MASKNSGFYNFDDDNDDDYEVLGDDSDEVELSTQASSVLAHIADLSFPGMFASLSIFDKISVASIAFDTYDDFIDDTDCELSQDEIYLCDENLKLCGKGIVDDLFRNNEKNRFWIITDKETNAPMYFPPDWIDFENGADAFDTGPILTFDYDSALEIVNYLEENGIDCDFIEMQSPYVFIYHFLMEMGASWVCLANDLDLCVFLDKEDLSNSNAKLGGLINLYSQNNIKNNKTVKENLLSEITKELRDAYLLCPVKVTKRKGNLAPVPDICLFQVEIDEEVKNIIPCFTSLLYLDEMPFPYDFVPVRFPFDFLAEASERTGMPIVIILRLRKPRGLPRG